MLGITTTILDITHRPVFYLKRNVSDTGFCFRLRLEFTQLGPIYRVCLYWAELSKFHLKEETESSLRNGVL
jgi:hypothetical protein